VEGFRRALTADFIKDTIYPERNSVAVKKEHSAALVFLPSCDFNYFHVPLLPMSIFLKFVSIYSFVAIATG